MVNRTQAVVLGFFLLAWLSLIGIFVVDPEIYRGTLKQLPGYGTSYPLLFLAVISIFISLLSVGVILRWRWTFWLILIAFAAGLLRIPASGLQLLRIIPPTGPAWYLLLQALIGLVQAVIALMMLMGYRRSGIWGTVVIQPRPSR
ncbi:MAG: hypothetical protein M3082_03120 [Candidatus Dormibacteraeota bacterium]|nr:hypothetical protein [Candidatus Dormibacteraeota bacterium]